MVGRGGGKRLENRYVIAPEQLQNIIRSEKDLERQRAACMANNVVESPTMNYANLNYAFKEEQVEEQIFQEELATDNHSEGFVNDDRAECCGNADCITTKSAKCGKTDAKRLNNPPQDLLKEQWEWYVKNYGSDELR
uniref:Uncharacterized protein n=1 Tax=Chenopodium quinoa TaxID=63459 RepID=A0A803N9S7_CHEQI